MTSDPPDSDFLQCLDACRAGDAGALTRLSDEFYSEVQQMVHQRLWQDLGSARKWMASRFSTGDVVQEVFRDVLRDPGAFRGSTRDAFRGYLSIIIRNRIVDAVRFHAAERRDVRRGDLAEDATLSIVDGEDPFEHAMEREALARLHEQLDQLDAGSRFLVRARIEGLATFQELADQLGYPSESRARRAFYRLRSRLVIALGGME